MTDEVAKEDSIKEVLRLMADSLGTMQHDMKLNDKGFLVLLHYHTGLPMKVCKKVVEACFELEGTYGR